MTTNSLRAAAQRLIDELVDTYDPKHVLPRTVRDAAAAVESALAVPQEGEKPPLKAVVEAFPWMAAAGGASYLRVLVAAQRVVDLDALLRRGGRITPAWTETFNAAMLGLADAVRGSVPPEGEKSDMRHQEAPLIAMAVKPLSDLLGMAQGGIPRGIARSQSCYDQVLGLLRTLHHDAADLRDERDGSVPPESAGVPDRLTVDALRGFIDMECYSHDVPNRDCTATEYRWWEVREDALADIVKRINVYERGSSPQPGAGEGK